MYAEFYRTANHVEYAVFAFVIFFVFFLGVLAWVFIGNRGRARLRWEHAALLPLDGDERPTTDADAHAGTGRQA
jgi:cbb3-type cytochrome oxidase subunit 3